VAIGRTEFIKKLIDETGLTIKAFSEKADLPYSTLRSMLDRGIGNASVNNVIKVCKTLGIKVEQLEEMAENAGQLSNPNLKVINGSKKEKGLTSEQLSKENHLIDDEKQLLLSFNMLNNLGKKEANKRVSELTELSIYITTKEEYNFAAHDDGLDPQEAKVRMEKAKDIFRKMDEE
jgi:lambda repressor-like predicted transcriptional regulator